MILKNIYIFRRRVGRVLPSTIFDNMFYTIKRFKKRNKQENKNGAGFTILELLVVIAIIGMLVSFVMVQMTGFRARSRDANREESIKQIQNALALYHTSHLRYPICATQVIINGTSDCMSAALVGDGAFRAAPIDPLGGSTGACNGANDYVYCYVSATGDTYSIVYRLETTAIQGKSPGWQPSVGP